jgi:hypothetical protein
MKEIRKTKDMTFTVEYENGDTLRVREGVLFAFDGNRITGHVGTSRPEALFSIAEALTEMICEFGLEDEFKKYIDPVLEQEK